MGLHKLFALALLSWGLPLYAQQWDSLRELKPGDSIKVLELSGKEHKGTFTAYSPGAVSLRAGNSEESVERVHVRRVQARSGARRARNVAIGAAIGLAVGLVTDQTLGTYLRNETGEGGGTRALTYVAPTAIFGAIAGIPSAYRTLYRVR